MSTELILGMLSFLSMVFVFGSCVMGLYMMAQYARRDRGS